jgi:hypothetical protein
MGLYAAQKTFFSSWLLWLGPVPLPAGYAAIAVIGAALAAKFVLESRWRWRDAGVVLAHFGALLLLCGGLLTAATAREGYLMIGEGQENAVVEDYTARHLTVTDEQNRVILDIPHTQLRVGRHYTAGPLRLDVVEYCDNAAPVARTAEEYDGLPYVGPAATIKMNCIPRDKTEESNHTAVTVAVRGSDSGQDGIYLMTNVMPHQPRIGGYTVRFGRVQRPLPFSVHLDNVKRELYPGTTMPRGYESQIHVRDGGAPWPATISMNAPLRYRGYTLYQSNYILADDGSEITVLSVVRNAGWLFPYIASLIIASGMILHIGILFAARGKAA